MSRKPVDGDEDPELVEEIAKARESLGQFTRKTSKEFEDPNPVRVEQHEKKLVNMLIKVGLIAVQFIFNYAYLIAFQSCLVSFDYEELFGI